MTPGDARNEGRRPAAPGSSAAGEPVVSGLVREAAALRSHRARLGDGDGSLDGLGDALERAAQELLVADEALRRQRAAVELLSGQLVEQRLGAERLWASLPVACLRTDHHAVVLEANAAAADLLGAALPRLVRTPLVTWVPAEQRGRLRSAVVDVLKGADTLRIPLSLRAGHIGTDEVLAFAEGTSDSERTVRWVVLPPPPPENGLLLEATEDVRALLAAPGLDDLCRRAVAALPARYAARLAVIRRTGESRWVHGDEPPRGTRTFVDDAYEQGGIRSWTLPDGPAGLAQPLRTHDRRHGVLLAWADDPAAFDGATRYLLQLVGLTAGSLIAAQEDLATLRRTLSELHLDPDDSWLR